MLLPKDEQRINLQVYQNLYNYIEKKEPSKVSTLFNFIVENREELKTLLTLGNLDKIESNRELK